MLTIYENRAGTLTRQKGKPRIGEEAVWIDLLNPTEDEEKKVERALKFNVPTREEQQEIEASSRLYQENGAYFMTATLLYTTEQGDPRTTPATFILAGQRLVTVRYAEPRAFPIFVARCNRTETDLKSGPAVLIGLLETIIDRLADFIERLQAEVEGLSHSIFELKGGAGVAAAALRRSPARHRPRGRDHLESARKRPLARAPSDVSHPCGQRTERGQAAASAHPHRGARRHFADGLRHLPLRQDYLLARCDAGQYQIQQNDIIKIFSVAAVVFLPPTLIASIYGMNFHFMPELSWWFGYPLAIALMILAAVLPYLYFKRRGWL